MLYEQKKYQAKNMKNISMPQQTQASHARRERTLPKA